MTEEQLDTYEELSNVVTLVEDNLFNAVGHLASMRLEDDETVHNYIVRVQEAIDDVNLQKKNLAEAKADKRAFVVGL